MILSNEPGFYAPGEYGIRLENLLLVQPADLPAATRPFLRFDVLSFAPFDRRLIIARMVPRELVTWLDAYHAQVRLLLSPQLHPAEDAAVLAWLTAATAPLPRD